MKAYDPTNILVIGLLGAAALSIALHAISGNADSEKINEKINSYVNKTAALDQYVARITVRKGMFQGRVSTLNGTVAMRDGDTTSFQIKGVFSEGFSELETWCPPQGECRTRIELDPDRMSQPQAVILVDAVMKETNAAVELHAQRGVVGRETARRSWNLD